MSLRNASTMRTICEVLREINDLLQGCSVHLAVLPKLAEAERMAKKMEHKLIEYNKNGFPEWWEENKDYEIDLRERLKTSYLVK